MNLLSSLFIALLLALLCVGCGRADLAGPPDMKLGRHECVECGMIIQEDRFSSAMLVNRSGRREHLLFDDACCMLDLERSTAEPLGVIARYVRDHPTREWIDADSAVFLFADRERLLTPMGSGIASFRERTDAERAQAEFGGELMDYPALVVARREWMEQRYGKPNN